MSNISKLAKANGQVSEVYKGKVTRAINSKYNLNDQIAIICNALETLLKEMPSCEHKDEFKAFLEMRKAIKDSAKEELE